MNYRHAYHAGNHADVLKHIVLALVLESLLKKPKPILFLDAHAGAGRTLLETGPAMKTGEWRQGVGLLHGVTLACEAAIAPWRAALAQHNPGGRLVAYPGSPAIAAALLRREDRMVLGELHPEDRAALRAIMAEYPQARVVDTDARVTVRAHLPPPERRGVILLDPPYEAADEADRALAMLADGTRRFATGQFLLWYPITGDGLDRRIIDGAARLGQSLIAELTVRTPRRFGGLAGSGVIIRNPPWQIEETLHLVLPELAAKLGRPGEANWRVVRAAPEKSEFH